MSAINVGGLRERFIAVLPQSRAEGASLGKSSGRSAGKSAGKSAGEASGKAAAIPVRDWINVGSNSPPARLQGFDQALVCVVIALLALGVVMVYSATVALPDSPKFARYTPTYFMTRQMLFVAVSFVAALVTVQVPVAFWEKASPWIFVASLLLLVLVLIPGIGKGVNGAKRWIPLLVLNFQPSELAKLAIAMYAASYMVRKMDIKEKFIRAVAPMAVALGDRKSVV